MKSLLPVAALLVVVGMGLFAFASAPAVAADPSPQATSVAPGDPFDPGAGFPSGPVVAGSVPPAGGWSPATNISQDSDPSGSPVMVIDDVGTVHLAWYDSSPGNWEILYNSKPVTGSWNSIAENVSANNSYSLVPALAADQGAIHVAWQDYGGPRIAWQGTLLYKAKESGQDFSPPEAISATLGFGGFPEVRDPNVLVDSQHTVHLTWAGITPTGYRVFYARKPLGGVWSFPAVINPGSGQCYRPRSIVDAANVVHVVWQEAPGAATQSDVFYSARSTGGVWTPPVNISHNAGNSDDPSLALGHDGTLFVVWHDYTIDPDQAEIMFARLPLGGQWTEPVNVSQTPGDSASPMLLEDTFGTLHLVWYDNTPSNWDILYATKPPLGSWTSAANVSQTPGRSGQPYIIEKPGSTLLHLAWADDSPPPAEESTQEFDVYYATKAAPGFSSSYMTGTPFALPGDLLAYTLVLRNPTASPATLSVTFTVPAEATYGAGSATASGGTVSEIADGVTWNGTVAARGEVRITIGGALGDGVAVGTTVRSRALISDAAGDSATVEAPTLVISQRVSLPVVVSALSP